MDIIFEINARFMAEVSMHWPADNERLSRLSIIEEGDEQQVRMAHLAIVGSFSVNGLPSCIPSYCNKAYSETFMPYGRINLTIKPMG